jgi:hypothetical protein
VEHGRKLRRRNLSNRNLLMLIWRARKPKRIDYEWFHWLRTVYAGISPAVPLILSLNMTMPYSAKVSGSPGGGDHEHRDP